MTNLVAFTGTLVLGLLSGSCAISGAFEYWRKWTRKVSEEEVIEIENKLFNVYQNIARKKESIALLDYEEKVRQCEEETSFTKNALESSGGQSRLRSLSRKLLAGLESWSTNAAKQRVGLLAECKAMEELARRLFMEWSEKCELWEFGQRKSYRKMYNAFGFVMMCLCVSRICGSTKNLLYGLQNDAEDSVTMLMNVILKFFPVSFSPIFVLLYYKQKDSSVGFRKSRYGVKHK
ncbi:GPCR-type G protein COLD1 [Galdieria sulphuraria]|nr:GPCR-type G protein COLD1 [Galdieria sulphuraria]